MLCSSIDINYVRDMVITTDLLVAIRWREQRNKND